jgi:hypothetical protein
VEHLEAIKPDLAAAAVLVGQRDLLVRQEHLIAAGLAEIMAAAAQVELVIVHIRAVVLEEMALAAQSVLSGPEIHVRSHQLVQVAHD